MHLFTAQRYNNGAVMNLLQLARIQLISCCAAICACALLANFVPGVSLLAFVVGCLYWSASLPLYVMIANKQIRSHHAVWAIALSVKLALLVWFGISLHTLALGSVISGVSSTVTILTTLLYFGLTEL